MKARATAALVLALLGLLGIAPAAHAKSPPRYCVINTGNGKRTGLEGVIVNGKCVAANAPQDTGSAAPKTRSIGCTADRTAIYEGHVIGGSGCDNAPDCPVPGADPNAAAYGIRAIEEQVQNPTTKQWTTVDFYCPAANTPAPAPTLADIRDRAIRLLPHVAIRTTSPNTLVNIQTILWAATSTRRDLGTVTVVGQPIRLRISFAHADWDFGDGHTERTTTPGTPYNAGTDPCDSKQCPDYYGHTYTATGRLTATVRIAWHAGYSLDGGTHWQPVSSTPLTGPTSRIPIRVRQTHVVLVNPDAAGPR